MRVCGESYEDLGKMSRGFEDWEGLSGVGVDIALSTYILHNPSKSP